MATPLGTTTPSETVGTVGSTDPTGTGHGVGVDFSKPGGGGTGSNPYVIPDGTGGGSSSSSGGGGSSAASAQAKLLAEQAAFASFREVLRRWGIPASKNMLNLIAKAVNQGWNSTLFVDHLRHTPDYHDKFPGLRYGEGMTEATYNAQYKSYRDQAKLIGENFSRQTFARALKNGVTPEEFKGRVQAIDSIEKWGPMMEGFKESLAANGYANKAENITKAQLMKFAMGLGPKKWEALWQETVVSTNIERVAGITVGTPPRGWGTNNPNMLGGGSPQSNVDHDFMHITRQDMLTVINQVESLTPGFEVESVTGQQWRDIGTRMRQFKGTYLAKYGITAKDLLEMELGGPRAAAIADKSQRILKEQEAFFDPRAVPQEGQQAGQPAQAGQEPPQTI